MKATLVYKHAIRKNWKHKKQLLKKSPELSFLEPEKQERGNIRRVWGKKNYGKLMSCPMVLPSSCSSGFIQLTIRAFFWGIFCFIISTGSFKIWQPNFSKGRDTLGRGDKAKQSIPGCLIREDGWFCKDFWKIWLPKVSLPRLMTFLTFLASF